MNRKQFAILVLLLLAGSPLFSQIGPDQYRPVFYFGGQKIYIGMPERAALVALSSCCKLSPLVELNMKKAPVPGAATGHFILPKQQSTQPILGAIYFSEGAVVRVSRELAPDVDTSNRDLVSFMRALKRALPEGSHSAVLTVKHESASNGESDVLTLVLPNGRGVEVRIGTLDTSNAATRRDFVTLDETLESSR